jgi:hypothetical protein
MKTQTTVLIVITIIVMQCKKQNTTTLSADKKPTALFVSTQARLLDTVWSAPRRYMHFLVTFDVITTDSCVYFSQLPVDYLPFAAFLGPDTIHEYTLYRPLIIPDIPEVVFESDIFKIDPHDTVRISYFGMIIAHGPWTQFYMQVYGFPYSLSNNDGIYESVIRFDSCFRTNYPQ